MCFYGQRIDQVLCKLSTCSEKKKPKAIWKGIPTKVYNNLNKSIIAM